MPTQHQRPRPHLPRRGEVWLFDFGMAGKTRPALVVSVPFETFDRALITVIPHTTSLRGSPFEISVTDAPFLKPGAFMVQGVTSFPHVTAIRLLGTLEQESFDKVLAGLLRWLGLVWLLPEQRRLGTPPL